MREEALSKKMAVSSWLQQFFAVLCYLFPDAGQWVPKDDRQQTGKNEFPILVEDGKEDELQQREHTYGEVTWSGSRPRANSKKGHKS